ncbi:hypothetical protein CTA1_1003 [Colletotrichum tanaceti]|uniref:Extracellular membrane protein CFEM domain-containing protein n=1 Tax=Colletotrichum tanaceti TaxID=1306861 RepID=A0A4U6XEB5_9PEZI|nr:hypothetical protein CTA1_1003 [Colletotrichum tanaceti]
MKYFGALALLTASLAAFADAGCQQRITPCSPMSVCEKIGGPETCGTTERADGCLLRRFGDDDFGDVIFRRYHLLAHVAPPVIVRSQTGFWLYARWESTMFDDGDEHIFSKFALYIPTCYSQTDD